MIRFATSFSGIEAPSVAVAPLGWRCVGVAEKERFPCAVLAHHYPGTPNLGDVLAGDILERYAGLHPDVMIGGPPCQDYSVAGLRLGIHGDRGNLTFRWAEILHAARPRFAVTENVPGWLTANKGLAFGAFLAGLVGHPAPLVPPAVAGGRWTNAGLVDGPLGRAAWRILDARYFHLAQRRERVFVVWCPANGGDPAQVLLEPQGVRGDFAAGGGPGEGVAGSAEASIGSRRSDVAKSIPARPWASHREDSDTLVAYGCNNTSGPIDVAGALNASHTASGRQDFETETFIAHTLRGEGHDASEDGTGRGVPLVTFQDRFRGDDGRGYGRVPPVTEDAIGTLETVKPWNIAGRIGSFQQSSMTGTGTIGYDPDSKVLRPVDTHADKQFLHMGMAVRRLTPVECARLQGFPDHYLDITYRGKPAADGPKYEALGNSMAVPVIRWLCERIARQLK